MGQLTNNYPLNRAGLFFIWRHGVQLKGTRLVNEHLRPALSLRPILKRRSPHLLTPSVNSAPMVLLPISRSSSSCLCLLRYQATSYKTKARQDFLRWVINCKRRHLAVATEAGGGGDKMSCRQIVSLFFGCFGRIILPVTHVVTKTNSNTKL